MAARSIGTGTLQFGLVTIPFKVYTATSPRRVSFTTLHKGCGRRLKQQHICASDGSVVERHDTIRGFEVAKGQFVTFTDEEIASLEVAATKTLRLEEFVSRDTVDFLSIEKTYFIGPDGDRAERPYRLLSRALEEEQAIGVGRFAQRGRDNLVLVRPYRGGLVIHECFYADEIRSFDEVAIGDEIDCQPEEVEFSRLLIRQHRRDSFDTTRYRDEWFDSITAAAHRKVAGEAVTVAPPVTSTPVVIDILDALRRSVAANRARLEADTAERERLRHELEAPRGPLRATLRVVASGRVRREES
jgi:DNA end-binding protein Ku